MWKSNTTSGRTDRAGYRQALTAVLSSVLFGGLAGCALGGAAGLAPATFGIGTPAGAADIARVDIDVMPDGTGLPTGGGTARNGQPVYAARCAACHGATGAEGPNDRLVDRAMGAGWPFAEDPAAKRTIGNYWPYATTLFDYIRRAMPVDRPGSLTDEEVYGLTAYVLYLNGIAGLDDRIDAQSLPRVQMPARERFVNDQRRGGTEIH